MIDTNKNNILGIFATHKHAYAAVMHRADNGHWDFTAIDFDGAKIQRHRNPVARGDQPKNFTKADMAVFLPINDESRKAIMDELQEIEQRLTSKQNPFYCDKALNIKPRFERKGGHPLDYHGNIRTDIEPDHEYFETFERSADALPKISTNCVSWMINTLESVGAIPLNKVSQGISDIRRVKNLRAHLQSQLEQANESGNLQIFDSQQKCGVLIDAGGGQYGYLFKNGSLGKIPSETGINFMLDSIPKQHIGENSLALDELLTSISEPMVDATLKQASPTQRIAAHSAISAGVVVNADRKVSSNECGDGRVWG